VTAPPESAEWPLVTDADHSFYFKPDGVQLLCSPADETPSEPVDARPEDVDIALAIERINEVTSLGIRSIRSSWAGLRTFAPDGSMVIGPDPDEPTFHWLVGQGGTGIQTAPAAAELLADLVIEGSTTTAFDPARFR
jgi:D-arginine dehydrogenase